MLLRKLDIIVVGYNSSSDSFLNVKDSRVKNWSVDYRTVRRLIY